MTEISQILTQSNFFPQEVELKYPGFGMEVPQVEALLLTSLSVPTWSLGPWTGHGRRRSSGLRNSELSTRSENPPLWLCEPMLWPLEK
jgi:hypothetical protein